MEIDIEKTETILKWSVEKLKEHGFQKWDDPDIMLIPKHMLEHIPYGTELVSISEIRLYSMSIPMRKL